MQNLERLIELHIRSEGVDAVERVKKIIKQHSK